MMWSSLSYCLLLLLIVQLLYAIICIIILTDNIFCFFFIFVQQRGCFRAVRVGRRRLWRKMALFFIILLLLKVFIQSVAGERASMMIGVASRDILSSDLRKSRRGRSHRSVKRHVSIEWFPGVDAYISQRRRRRRRRRRRDGRKPSQQQKRRRGCSSRRRRGRRAQCFKSLSLSLFNSLSGKYKRYIYVRVPLFVCSPRKWCYRVTLRVESSFRERVVTFYGSRYRRFLGREREEYLLWKCLMPLLSLSKKKKKWNPHFLLSTLSFAIDYKIVAVVLKKGGPSWGRSELMRG